MCITSLKVLQFSKKNVEWSQAVIKIKLEVSVDLGTVVLLALCVLYSLPRWYAVKHKLIDYSIIVYQMNDNQFNQPT